MGFEIVETSMLKIFKMPIRQLAGFADHYYLAEIASIHNSVGWGTNGLELRGIVRVTSTEIERIERFISASKNHELKNLWGGCPTRPDGQDARPTKN